MFKYLISFVVLFSSFASDFRESEDFKNLEESLVKVKTIKGNLVQNFQGERLKAEFSLKLPSKLKIDYQSPEMPIKIIITPSVMTYYDKKLDQKSQIATSKNASSLLLTSKISLNDPRIKIKSFKRSLTGVEFSHISMPENNFKIFFLRSEDGFNLHKIETNEGLEKIITEFQNIIINDKIDEKEFQILNKKVDTKLDY